MGIKIYRPTSPGRRGMSVSDFEEITRSTPERSLLRPVLKQAGRNNVVSVNLGSAAGLAVGDVLAIKQRGDVVPDREAKHRGEQFLATTRVPLIQLPSEPIGHLLVFRVFDNIAYGLIMASSRAVSVGDEVANP